jgi:hypothetical protein
VGEVNVKLEVILWGRRRVVINLYEAIFEGLKLVKQLLKGNQYLPDCAVTTVFATSLKQLGRLGKRREELHILVDCCPVASVEASLAQKQSGRL